MSFYDYLNNNNNIEKIDDSTLESLIESFQRFDVIDSQINLQNQKILTETIKDGVMRYVVRNAYIQEAEGKSGGGGGSKGGGSKGEGKGSKEKAKEKGTETKTGEKGGKKEPVDTGATGKIKGKSGLVLKPVSIAGKTGSFMGKRWEKAVADMPGGHPFPKSINDVANEKLGKAAQGGANAELIGKAAEASKSFAKNVSLLHEKLNNRPDVKESMIKQLEHFRESGLQDVAQKNDSSWLNASEKAIATVGGDLSKFYPDKSKLEARYKELAQSGDLKANTLYREMMNRTLEKHGVPKEFFDNPKGWEKENGKLEDKMQVPGEKGKEQGAKVPGKGKEKFPEGPAFDAFMKMGIDMWNKQNPDKPIDAAKMMSNIKNKIKELNTGAKAKGGKEVKVEPAHREEYTSKTELKDKLRAKEQEVNDLKVKHADNIIKMQQEHIKLLKDLVLQGVRRKTAEAQVKGETKSVEKHPLNAAEKPAENNVAVVGKENVAPEVIKNVAEKPTENKINSRESTSRPSGEEIQAPSLKEKIQAAILHPSSFILKAKKDAAIRAKKEAEKQAKRKEAKKQAEKKGNKELAGEAVKEKGQPQAEEGKWDQWINPQDAKDFISGNLDQRRIESVTLNGKNGQQHLLQFIKRKEGEDGLEFRKDTKDLRFERINKEGKRVGLVKGQEELDPGNFPVKITMNVGSNASMFTNKGQVIFAGTNGKLGQDRGVLQLPGGILGPQAGKFGIAKLIGKFEEHRREARQYNREKKAEGRVRIENVKVAMRGENGEIERHIEVPMKAERGGNIEHMIGFQPIGGKEAAMHDMGLTSRGAEQFARGGFAMLKGDLEHGMFMYLDKNGQVAPELKLKPGESVKMDPEMKKRMESVAKGAKDLAEKAVSQASDMGLKNAQEWAKLSPKEVLNNWEQWRDNAGEQGKTKASLLNLAKKLAGYHVAVSEMVKNGKAENLDSFTTSMLTPDFKKKGKNLAENLKNIGAKNYFGGKPILDNKPGQVALEKLVADKKGQLSKTAQGVIKARNKQKAAEKQVKKEAAGKAEKAGQDNVMKGVKDNPNTSPLTPEDHKEVVDIVRGANVSVDAHSHVSTFLNGIKEKAKTVINYLLKGAVSINKEAGGKNAEKLLDMNSITSIEKIGRGVSGGYFAKLKSGMTGVVKVLGTGRTYSGDDALFQTLHEVAAAHVSKQLGQLPSTKGGAITGSVPNTVMTHLKNTEINDIVSVQEKIGKGSEVQGKKVESVWMGHDADDQGLLRKVDQGEINTAAVADFVMGSQDRHRENFGVARTTDGAYHALAIDNGYAFPTSVDKGKFGLNWSSIFSDNSKGSISSADKTHIKEKLSDKYIDSLPLRGNVKQGMKDRRDIVLKMKDYTEVKQAYRDASRGVSWHARILT